MEQIIKIYRFLLVEPPIWLFYCFFQPNRFKRDFSVDYKKRIIPMLQLALLIFLISFSLVLTLRCTLLHYFYAHIYPESFSNMQSIQPLILNVAQGIAWSIAWGILVGIVCGLEWGVVVGLLVTFMAGISWGISGTELLGGLLGLTLWCAGGVFVGGIMGLIAGIIANLIARSIARPVAGALLGSMIGATCGSILWGIWGAILAMIADVIVCIVLMDIMGWRRKVISDSTIVGIGIGLGTGLCIIVGLSASIKSQTYHGLQGLGGVVGGIVGSIPLGLLFGLILGKSLGLRKGVALGVTVGLMEGVLVGLALGIEGGIARGIQVFVAFTVSFLLGYYRIPLYPFSAFSGFRNHLACRKNPIYVFTYLHRSSLYWDERVYLPIPGLKRTLLIAADQDIKRTLEEIDFIVYERPQQIGIAKAVSLEIIISDLEMREDLQSISKFSQRLTEILPQEARLIDPSWALPFARLNDASLDAARYSSPLGRQARHAALEEMFASLKRVHFNTAFDNVILNLRLSKIVERWLTIARNEIVKLESLPQEIGQIDNPYNPGPALELSDSLFVGRRDLAQQLGEALGRWERRPTFLLNGERRMGKSSILKQLPDLLGAHYIPIVYDLQMRGTSSSIVAFFGTIAREIYELMIYRGVRVNKLEHERLQEASRKNDAAIYYVFDEWLADVMQVLESNERTLLLAFDEFEKLEEAGQARYLDLNLLLDWFRSVIQNRPRLALLFSGVRTLGELGPNWASYFVNVQTLHVGFLRKEEARQLITEPTPNFPGEEIFSEGVINQILDMTACHPFIIQAVCSSMIENLNIEKRKQADFNDVTKAAIHVLEAWWDGYFRDLWNRTDQDQQACLLALKKLSRGNLQDIFQESGLDERSIRSAIRKLCKRDLVLEMGADYQIASPIFELWVEQNR